MERTRTVVLVETSDRVNELVKAAQRAGLTAEIVERSSEVDLSITERPRRKVETVFLRCNEAANRHAWFWTTGFEIGPADDPDAVILKVKALLDSTRDAM